MADVKKPTQEDIEKGLKLLEQARKSNEKMKEKLKNNPEIALKAKEKEKRRQIRISLLVEKALKAGITVTEKEIDDRFKATKVGK